MNTTPQVELASLSDSDEYRVRAEDTDPRGWPVVAANDVTLGTVTDLIIDVEGLVARYIVCSLERAEDRGVLIPMGFARLNEQKKEVRLDYITAQAVSDLPTFAGLPVSAKQLAETEKALTGAAPITSSPAKIVRRSDATRNAS